MREDDRASAFRRKTQWVIQAPRHHATWHFTVLCNLSRHYFADEQHPMLAVRSQLERGLKRETFDRLKLLMDAPTDDLLKAIGLPARTLARRAVFKQDESERLLRVASVFQHALDVFRDLDKARAWFSKPRRALGDQTPLAFCNTEPGAEEVKHLLGRIEHGVFS